ncbi:MAG: hypothetical protein XD81_0762 [Bacteroidetes bacterium 38_7]|jgi:hypothetical protein|nr:MAG: hypothetical protein XD81_0762 [Bacteroidetes bacterium 38_7]HCC86472.1 hypothetical protein [Porphyromonadaceae bacterium]
MIYNKSTYSRIILLFLILAGIILVVLLVLGMVEYRQYERKLREETSLLFEQAINDEVKLKMENEYVYINIVNDPSVTKENVRNQTIRTEDTIITREAKVEKDFSKFLMRNYQTYLLHVNRLQPDTLQQIFNAKLDENGIKARSFILVQHEYEPKMSGDTAGYRINYRTPVITGGIFNEITYQGLLSYSPLTVFRLMPKDAIITLLILEVLMLAIVHYLYIEKRKIRPDKIFKKGEHYYIGEIRLNTLTQVLVAEKKMIKLPKQQFDILLMFLESDEYAIDKNELMGKFWSKSTKAKESMVSAINKLRNYLKEAGCTFNIHTKKGGDCYILEYVGEGTDISMVEPA